MQWVNDRDAAALGAVLLPLVETLGGAPALSPERSPATTRAGVSAARRRRQRHPVHGDAAPGRVSRGARERGREVAADAAAHPRDLSEDVAAADAWRLVRFWTEMLDAAR